MTRIFPTDRMVSMVSSTPQQDRLGLLLELSGCTFHDNARRLVATPSVSVALLGGMPAQEFADLGSACDSMLDGMGLSAFFSYLSVPGGGGLADAAEVVVNTHGHPSIMHAAHVGLVVAGVSCAVENEFNSQRDLVHMSRITEARTGVQSRPPVVVPHPGLLDAYAAMLEAADRCRAAIPARTPDELEAANLLYPAGKATAFLVSGTLRSFARLVQAQHDTGKEAEYRRALGLIRECLAGMWPSLFPNPAAHSNDTPESRQPPVGTPQPSSSLSAL